MLYIDNVFRSTTGVLPRKLVETILRAAGRIMPVGGEISISSVLRTVFNIQDFWSRPFDFLPESEVTDTDVKRLKSRLIFFTFPGTPAHKSMGSSKENELQQTEHSCL